MTQRQKQLWMGVGALLNNAKFRSFPEMVTYLEENGIKTTRCNQLLVWEYCQTHGMVQYV